MTDLEAAAAREACLEEPASEAELLTWVLAACERRQILAHHCPDSRACTGTPGLPDLVMVGRKMLFAELKSRPGETSAEQDNWLWHLNRCVVPWVVWRPQDWSSGIVLDMLNAIANQAAD